MLDTRLINMELAGGSYNLISGQWLDNISTVECQQCPSADPSIVLCMDNKVVSQPGYYSVYTAGARRSEDHPSNQIEVPNSNVPRSSLTAEWLLGTPVP